MDRDRIRALNHTYRQAFARLCAEVDGIRSKGDLPELDPPELDPDVIQQLPGYQAYRQARNDFGDLLKNIGKRIQSVSAGT